MNPFSDRHMAIGYARARPGVHPHVIALLDDWLSGRRFDRVLDVGCGAGLSTRPLLGLARACVAIDPSEAMVAAARQVVPEAVSLVAAAEAIPLPDRAIGLATAAGSLNFARDLDACWPELARVIEPDGVLAVYDFSVARTFASGDTTGLVRAFGAFAGRYPSPVSQAIPLSPAILADRAPAFRLMRGESFALPLPLTADTYVRYLLTETNVHAAIRRGVPVEDVETWLTTHVAPLFEGVQRDLLFEGYLAVLTPRA
ncbi:MAG: class I SAM-dependent methyltransferase [Acidobacteria bacterium]|nr:class I SAM-dependent methyltransferase [Acidobacteriota bacterium]